VKHATAGARARGSSPVRSSFSSRIKVSQATHPRVNIPPRANILHIVQSSKKKRLLVDTSTPPCLRVTSLPPARYLATARREYTRASYNGVHASSGRRRLPRGDGAAPTLNFRDRIEISDDGTPRHAGARIYPRLPGSRLRPPRVLPQPPARGSPERFDPSRMAGPLSAQLLESPFQSTHAIFESTSIGVGYRNSGTPCVWASALWTSSVGEDDT
jgi:hypothetical protein